MTLTNVDKIETADGIYAIGNIVTNRSARFVGHNGELLVYPGMRGQIVDFLLPHTEDNEGPELAVKVDFDLEGVAPYRLFLDEIRPRDWRREAVIEDVIVVKIEDGQVSTVVTNRGPAQVIVLNEDTPVDNRKLVMFPAKNCFSVYRVNPFNAYPEKPVSVEEYVDAYMRGQSV